MIYLASPYTNPDQLIRSWRYQKALEYTAEQMRLGAVIFSPIAYGHQFTKYGIAAEYEPWHRFNLSIMAMCTQFHILCLPGWESSRGIAAELKAAQGLNHLIKEIPYGESL